MFLNGVQAGHCVRLMARPLSVRRAICLMRYSTFWTCVGPSIAIIYCPESPRQCGSLRRDGAPAFLDPIDAAADHHGDARLPSLGRHRRGRCRSLCVVAHVRPRLLAADVVPVDVFVAVHKVPLRGNLVLYVAVGVVSILFLARSFRYLTHEAHLPRVQESREFFSKLRGFSLKKATYTQVDVDKNLMRVSVSIAHLQGLALFFVVFVFVSQRFVARFDPDVSLAASVIVPAALAYAAAL